MAAVRLHRGRGKHGRARPRCASVRRSLPNARRANARGPASQAGAETGRRCWPEQTLAILAGGFMRVAVFTDNDFAKVNGVTTTLRAVLRWAPADLDVRIYTAASHGQDDPGYLALRSVGVGLPFYRE